jgi:hypothetical protein
MLAPCDSAARYEASATAYTIDDTSTGTSIRRIGAVEARRRPSSNTTTPTNITA